MKYSRRPIVIEAERFDPHDADQCQRYGITHYAFGGKTYHVMTQVFADGRKGITPLVKGDWITVEAGGVLAGRSDLYMSDFEVVSAEDAIDNGLSLKTESELNGGD